VTLNIPFTAQQQARSQRAQIAENTGRHARAWGFKNTRGFGEYQHPEVIDFQLAFLGMPTMSYGYALNNVELIDTRFPRAHGFVHRWRIDGDGNYRGCWVSTVVETTGGGLVISNPEPNYPLVHSFEFNGMAYKALPDRIGASMG
jgi:hypothetical protein